MSFTYAPPPDDGHLHQGELLGRVWEHKALLPPSEIERDQEVSVRPVFHRRVVVLNPLCDLYWDYEDRDDAEDLVPTDDAELEEEEDARVPNVLLCDAFVADEVKTDINNRHVWKRVRRNQHRRYHTLRQAEIADGEGSIPALTLDFRRFFTLPTRYFYPVLGEGVERIARIPELFREDLMQRFTSFLGRVSLPD